MEENILQKKKKCNAKWGDESTSKKKKKKEKEKGSIIPWPNDFEDKCLATTHKIESFICAVLLWIYTHLKSIQIFCILQ